MSLLEMLHTESTHQHRVRPIDPDSVTVTFGCRAAPEPVRLSRQDQYRASLTVGVVFWANQAEYDRALAFAKRKLLRTLYADTLKRLDQIAREVWDKNTNAALVALEELRRELVE